MKAFWLILFASLALVLAAVPAAPQPAEGKPPAFVSTEAGGNWSALATWQSQDGAAPKRAPGDGDMVTISGPVTVDVPVTVGTGTGDAIVVAKGGKLVVAAALTLKGNLLVQTGASLSGKAGAGIEFDAAKDVAPMVGAAGTATLTLWGEPEKHFFVRTKPGSAGFTGSVQPKGPNDRLSLWAQYTDFSDLGAASKKPSGGEWGRRGVRIASPTAPSQLVLCTFTRASLEVSGDAASAPVAISRCIMTDTTTQGGGGVDWGARISCEAKNPNISVEMCGFDKLVLLEYLKSVRSCVFARNWYPFKPKLADEWSDNLGAVVEAGNGYLKPPPGVYRRSYWFCADGIPNAHFMFLNGAGSFTFDRCIWDAPVSSFIDDALDAGKGATVLVERCLTVLRAGSDTPEGRGCSLGYVFGGKYTYRHNTITLGPVGVYGDTSHGGKPGDMVEFRDNLCWLPDGFGKGQVFYNLDVTDWFDPAAVHHNALYNAEYHKLGVLPKPSAKGDVTGENPKFADPSRRLISFWRQFNKLGPGDAKTAQADAAAALDWIRQHPEKVPELINWVFAGFVPTNGALKAASDPDGPTKGWIGAMEGNATAPR